MAVEELQVQADQILRGQETEDSRDAKLAGVEEERAPFSAFIPSQLRKARDLASRLMQLADQEGGDAGVAAALEEAASVAEQQDLNLVKHAVELFITHHREASRLAIPPIPAPTERRRPTVELADAEADPEAPLDWFREDLLANDHHRHWHVVYSGEGRPTPSGEPALQDRQGELFFYMHEQMLARYDAERRALGLAAVKSFEDYSEAIPETHGDRPPGRRLVDVNRPGLQITVGELNGQRQAIWGAAEQGSFERPGQQPLEVTTERLAATEEPTAGSVWEDFWHHGYGHMLCAYVMAPGGPGSPGDIGSTNTAIRDPWFWRWHRHIDDLSFAWQERQQPYSFDDAPAVEIRSALNGQDEQQGSPDIILCYEKDLPGQGQPGTEEQAAAWGQERFGGANWDRAPAADDGSQDVLQTRMAQAPFDPGDPDSEQVSYLDHERFAYFLRVENATAQPSQVTARIFLVPAEAADDRRAWIEMDKFELTLQAQQGAVVHRPGRLASVVRKPATPTPLFIQPPADSPHEQYCRCGWPYHMLLPRGTKQGMACRLLVMLTDWQVDRVGGDDECGSLSFCGAVDRYPDSREMGYPFNRPFAEGKPPAEVLGELRNVAARNLTIRFAG